MMKERYSCLKNGLNFSKCCFYCGAAVYRLSDGRIKCRACRRRYSPKKICRRLTLAQSFCRNQSVKAAVEQLGISYVSAKNFYDHLRKSLLPLLESDYEAAREQVEQYEETLYLDHNKRRDKRYIFDAQNFLTFVYGNRVYNILMPSLERYKTTLLEDGMHEQYWKEFSRFLIFHRIARLESHDNAIERFRHYFDGFMKPYRGVDRENFIYYLKEAEFKFNYKEKCFEKLIDLLRRAD
ncbi:transposase [Hydrogenimonas urashimensis]|uniref:transposase n=1 Tax=Hydrogenimonas urashimensis TaxID=2740515 RepID=UPI001914E2FB|nr:transposase [Hydrogenimonas urashimensis]